MTRPLSRSRRASFIIRVVRDRHGSVSGVIERVATGAKEAFQGVDAIGPVIAGMLARETTNPPTGAETQRSPGNVPIPGE